MAEDLPEVTTSLYLEPLNARARQALSHDKNRPLVASLNGVQVLQLGALHPTSPGTLAKLGRDSTADIFIDASSISRIQCSFEVEEHSGSVMLYDRSHSSSTMTLGDNAMSFRPGVARKVLIHDMVNTEFGMGGVNHDLIRFAIRWQRPAHLARASMRDVFKDRSQLQEPPENARTLQEEAVIGRPAPRLRIRAPAVSQVRFVQEECLGSGTSGTVHRAVNVDDGRLMALKIISMSALEPLRRDEERRRYKQEIETLARISHPNIVNYISHEEVWPAGEVKLFMGLKDGSLESLTRQDLVDMDRINVVFSHALQALDYLHSQGFIHRDIKPANILYTRHSESDFTFQLSDFGTCNRESQLVDGSAFCGTTLFMPPEILFRTGHPSSKWDIWSLYVTAAVCLNIDGIREADLNTAEDVVQKVVQIAQMGPLESLRDMVAGSPEDRPSASELKTWFP